MRILLTFTLYTFFFSLNANATDLSQAIEIARKGLAQNVLKVSDPKDKKITRYYLVAGGKQYRSLWAWDFAFASFGAILIGQTQAVKDTLTLYFSHQRTDGLIPRNIGHYSNELRVILSMVGITLPFKNPLESQFETENGVISFIPNVILPWTAGRYALHTKDLDFARKYFSHAERSIVWIDANAIENGLVCRQEPFSDWEDSVQRTGCVAFTNTLYALSLKSLSDWALMIGDQKKQQEYSARLEQFMQKFRSYFWDSKRMVLRNFTGNEHLTADANLLAVAFGLMDERQSELIMKTLKASPLWQPYPGRATWPNYPLSIKSKFPRLVGLEGYHDEIRWGWITALAAMAEKRLNHTEEAQKILEAYAKQIVTDGNVCEVYDYDEKKNNIQPVSRLVYTAERPFSWSAGMFLEATLGPVP